MSFTHKSALHLPTASCPFLNLAGTLQLLQETLQSSRKQNRRPVSYSNTMVREISSELPSSILLASSSLEAIAAQNVTRITSGLSAKQGLSPRHCSITEIRRGYVAESTKRRCTRGTSPKVLTKLSKQGGPTVATSSTTRQPAPMTRKNARIIILNCMTPTGKK